MLITLKYLKSMVFKLMKSNLWLMGVILLISTAFLFCTFEQDDNTPLTIERVDLMGDTIVPWGTLIFVFSVPLEDGVATLKITPNPGAVYNCLLSDSKDTLYLNISGFLEANTSFSISLENDFTAENGSVLLAEDVDFTVFTGNMENEPNNSIETSDSLNGRIFGIAENKSDEDFFILADTLISEISLINHKKKNGFQILDINGTIMLTNENLDDTLNEIISLINIWPKFIKVYPLVDSDSRYELEVR